ncbi:hypothetical protein NIES2101_09945 [Calothrix sp. HK-06]|nr:hypothetical protein NIES2101_09945 [Calothrix sp. HK-06]
MEQLSFKSSIPEAKITAVEKALQTAFNTTIIENIELLTGGLSGAIVYKIIVGGKPYALRLIMRIDPLNDPVRQYTCMNIAAEAGIAPYVYYSSVENALSITDFIDAKPLFGYSIVSDELLLKLVETIRAIHSTKLFPKLVNFLDGVDGFIAEFKASGLLSERATEEHFSYYSQIQEVYPRYDTDLVSSHNDLMKNILFDGKKVWVIDWEVAFQNDRYVDLATVANNFISTEAREEMFLKAYFGDSLDEYKRARFFLMQQVCHMFYAMIFMKFALKLQPKNSVCVLSMDTPRLREFYRQVGAREISLMSYEGQLLFGKVILNEILHNMKTPKFTESINKMR